MEGWKIFIIILFIVGFIYFYNPHIFDSIKRIILPANKVRIVPGEEYGLYNSCASLEIIGESQGISDIKAKVCKEACGKRNMEYSFYDCEKDRLVCYCII
jgi:hypothetical protein